MDEINPLEAQKPASQIPDNRFWLKNYQKGVPRDIDPERYASIPRFFREHIEQYAKRDAFSNFGSALTYEQLGEHTEHLAAFLQSLGLKQGERIALMVPNILAFPISFFAILRIGAVVVNVNPLYTAEEVLHQVNDAQCKAIIVMENVTHTVSSILKKTSIEHVLIAKLGDGHPWLKGRILNFVNQYIKKNIVPYNCPKAILLETAMTQGIQLPFKAPDIASDDVALLQYTGGTTGSAKGAMLTHRNVIANIEQASNWISPMISGHGKVMTPLPLYHIFSLLTNCLTFIKFGMNNVLITDPRDTKGFIKTMKQNPFVAITGVSTLFNALLNEPSFKDVDFSQVCLVVGGGMAVSDSVAEQWQKVTGVPLLQGYGLTEASPVVSMTPLYQTKYLPSIGLPLPSTDISIQDEKGISLGINEIGELCVKGPQVMKGYWQKEDETAMAIIDGWLHTGDMAKMDEAGYIYIVDRMKDMVVVSGFNVYPNEVEQVITAHPDVLEVGVTGEKTEDGNEQVVAFVIKNDDRLSEEQVIEYCRAHLTRYKIPKKVYFVLELPKSPVGKILRKDLMKYKP